MSISTHLPRGLYVAPVTPFREDESVDLPALESLTRHLVNEAAADGVLACGYTGEIASLTEDEQTQIVATISSVTRTRVPLICGIRPTSTLHTIEFGRELAAAGADGLLVNSPFSSLMRRQYAKRSDIAVKFFADLAEGTGLPLTVFQYPSSSGVNYPPELLAEICAIPGVVGVKNSGGAAGYSDDRAAVEGRVSMFADSNTYDVLAMMSRGQEVLLVGVSNVAPRLWREFYDAWSRGEISAAVDLANRKLLPIMRAITGDQGSAAWSFVARIKEALTQTNVLARPVVRAPEPSVTATDRDAVRSLLAILAN
ncbi:dihydrodipicolinate synthase family protein [Microbacterium sp. EST19A]|uniref:dihydrodipicolinate synthase family protein n=1 Tax=Microbacterium sp. EST19A TaxID=2862681 RepID=UPI001CC069E7|nr:dihydrodipicolinate synthase family protein [Microbacterium sp. EST19A]